MDAIIQLQTLGYRVNLEGDKIRLIWQGESGPNPEQVTPLLEEVRARKQEALRYIRHASRHKNRPGKCESCRAGGYWPDHGDGLWCFFHAYFFGKCAPAQKVTDEVRESCPLKRYGARARKVWTN